MFVVRLNVTCQKFYEQWAEFGELPPMAFELKVAFAILHAAFDAVA